VKLKLPPITPVLQGLSVSASQTPPKERNGKRCLVDLYRSTVVQIPLGTRPLALRKIKEIKGGSEVLATVASAARVRGWRRSTASPRDAETSGTGDDDGPLSGPRCSRAAQHRLPARQFPFAVRVGVPITRFLVCLVKRTLPRRADSCRTASMILNFI